MHVPLIAAILVLGTLGLVIANGVDTPQNWGKPESERVVDLKATAHVDWHPTTGEWTIDAPTVQAERATWVSISAILSNLLSFTSPSERVVFDLQDDSGVLVQEKTDHTGSGKFTDVFTSGHDVHVTFTNVHLRAYVLDARIVDDQGKTLAEQSSHLTLTTTGAG